MLNTNLPIFVVPAVSKGIAASASDAAGIRKCDPTSDHPATSTGVLTPNAMPRGTTMAVVEACDVVILATR